jgi:hypothetical protein
MLKAKQWRELAQVWGWTAPVERPQQRGRMEEGRHLEEDHVPQEGSSVEGPRRWRDCTDRIQVEEDQQKERRRKGPQEGGQSGRTAPVARLL